MNEKIRYLAKHKIDKNKYIAELSSCMAVVTTNDSGEIIRVAIFGLKDEEQREETERRIRL